MIARAKIAHFTDQGREVRGVVHVGAHEGQEIPYYLQMGHTPILAIEPHPDVCSALRAKYDGDDRVQIVQVALGDVDGWAEMFIPRHLHDFSDDSQSGSILMPDHDSSYPWGDRGVEGRYVGVYVSRFDQLIWNWWTRKYPDTIPDSSRRVPHDLSDFNTLVMDVQGYELQALEGFGHTLDAFDFLNIECSREPIYKGGAAAQEVIDFLAKQGFRQDSPIQDHDDIFFMRTDI